MTKLPTDQKTTNSVNGVLVREKNKSQETADNENGNGTDIAEQAELGEKVIAIDRISRTVKGGRRIRFRAIVVVGNRNGRVGVGCGKAADVQGAIAKAKYLAEKIMIDVKIINGTIAHPVMEVYGTSRVLLKPAPAGHSIIAGQSIRAVIELSGIINIVSKSIGSANALNNAMATYQALKKLSLEKDQPKTVKHL